MSETDRVLEWLRHASEKLDIAELLLNGKMHLAEIGDALSLSRKMVAHHEKALERMGLVTSYLDTAPEDYPAVMVRYVELTPEGRSMVKYLRPLESTTKRDEK